MSLAERFGRNLAACRKRVGVSQEEVAFRADLHRTAVGQIERAERVPRIDTLIKLAGALNMSPCDLLAGLEWQPGDYRPGSFTLSAASGALAPARGRTPTSSRR